MAFKTRGVVVAAALLLATACVAQAGPDLGNWRVDAGSDGQVTASLYATNKLITGNGALGYSPVLTLACRPGGEPRWSEWLQLNDAVSASRKITMSVMLDGGSKFDESWSVGPRGKLLVREGDDGIKRMVSASRLLLSWRFGLLSGRGEADFDLAGLSEAIGQMASSCNTDPP